MGCWRSHMRFSHLLNSPDAEDQSPRISLAKRWKSLNILFKLCQRRYITSTTCQNINSVYSGKTCPSWSMSSNLTVNESLKNNCMFCAMSFCVIYMCACLQCLCGGGALNVIHRSQMCTVVEWQSFFQQVFHSRTPKNTSHKYIIVVLLIHGWFISWICMIYSPADCRAWPGCP